MSPNVPQQDTLSSQPNTQWYTYFQNILTNIFCHQIKLLEYKNSAIPKWNTSGVKSASKTDDHNLWPVFDKFSHSACELQRFSISIFCGQFPPHLAMNLLPVTLLSRQAVSSSFYITEDFQPSQMRRLDIQRVLALCYFWDLAKSRISQKSH